MPRQIKNKKTSFQYNSENSWFNIAMSQEKEDSEGYVLVLNVSLFKFKNKFNIGYMAKPPVKRRLKKARRKHC